ncbi:uncharacterized protein ARMOST_11968 [Armillaria ostoyae]|uniref:Uncharacterized protein n=1 Tax=Armillaria ostoyae TaxID=47428 RepID=A0A284RIL9_ARMOS|nr:uncharacterized protein ARMOST_11968 [Armillaria ostoyae]
MINQPSIITVIWRWSAIISETSFHFPIKLGHIEEPALLVIPNIDDVPRRCNQRICLWMASFCPRYPCGQRDKNMKLVEQNFEMRLCGI